MSNVGSALYVGASQGMKILTSFASLAVLSRLLPPEDFGTFALVMAIIGIAELFRDFGLSLAAIQAPEVTPQQRSNLFWANTLIGLLLTVGTIAAAPAIAAAYGRSDLALIVASSGCAFVLNGISAQYRVGLVRAGRFRHIAIVDTLSPILALIVAVVLAAVGAGVYSLVAQALVLALATVVLLIAFGRWIPGLPTRAASIRDFVGVGTQLLSVGLVTYVGNNLDKVLVGKFYGAAALGFYSKAFTFYQQPLNQLLSPFTNLVVAALSKVRESPVEYLRQLLQVQTVINYVGFPVFAFVVGAAPSIVPLLLGSNWGASIPILQVLCVGGTFQLLGFIYYWHFLASAQSKVFLRCTLISQPIAIALIVASCPFGITAVAWGVSLGFFVEWLVPAAWGMARTLERPGLLLRNMVRPLVVALAVLAGSAGPSIFLVQAPDLLKFMASVAGSAVLAAVLVLCVPRIRSDFAGAVVLARDIARSRASRSVAAE